MASTGWLARMAKRKIINICNRLSKEKKKLGYAHEIACCGACGVLLICAGCLGYWR